MVSSWLSWCDLGDTCCCPQCPSHSRAPPWLPWKGGEAQFQEQWGFRWGWAVEGWHRTLTSAALERWYPPARGSCRLAEKLWLCLVDECGCGALRPPGGQKPTGCPCPAPRLSAAAGAAMQRDTPALAAGVWAGGGSTPVQSSCREPVQITGFGVVLGHGPGLGARLSSPRRSPSPDLQPDAWGHRREGRHPRGAPHH